MNMPNGTTTNTDHESSSHSAVQRKRIAIIGGGAAGTLFAARAVRELQNTDLILIERSGNFGPGLAYTLSDPVFLLNVPAARMGGFAENHAHFYEWLQKKPERWRALHPDLEQVDYGPHDFVPRMVYGAYLQDLIEGALTQARDNGQGNWLDLVAQSVQKIEPAQDGAYALRLVMDGRKAMEVDAVILANGNSAPRSFAIKNGAFSNIYDPKTLAHLLKINEDVLILGTGLSMVDAVHALTVKGYTGTITAISRRGLLPLPHAENHGSVPAPFDAQSHPRTASGLVRALKYAAKDALQNNTPWQYVIDSVRSLSDTIWANLDEAQQKRLGRIRPWWNIIRHRIPHFVHAEIMDLMDKGRMRLVNGHIDDITGDDQGRVHVRLKDGRTFSGGTILNCIGFDYAARSVQALCPDIPLSTHWSGGVAPVEGNPAGRISAEYPVYALGPMLSGFYFESTAVNEIRAQAERLCMAQ